MHWMMYFIDYQLLIWDKNNRKGAYWLATRYKWKKKIGHFVNIQLFIKNLSGGYTFDDRLLLNWKKMFEIQPRAEAWRQWTAFEDKKRRRWSILHVNVDQLGREMIPSLPFSTSFLCDLSAALKRNNFIGQSMEFLLKQLLLNQLLGSTDIQEEKGQ